MKTMADDYDTDLERARRKRSRSDLQKIIGLVLDSPLNDAPMEEVTGELSVQSLATMNTDMKSRIILRAALSAANGDLKSAEFLMKYGGYTPPVESEVSVDIPTIVDDIGSDPIPVEAAEEDDAMEGMSIYEGDDD